jgi:small basic protein
MILLPLFAAVLGFVIVYVWRLSIPMVYSSYVSVGILAGLDSVIGGTRSALWHRFDSAVFVSGFFTNIVLASLLVYAGDRLGVELYLPAIVALGVRIFYNVGYVRRAALSRFLHRPLLPEPSEVPESFSAPPAP